MASSIELDTLAKLNRERTRPRLGERWRSNDWLSKEARRPSRGGEEGCGECRLELAGSERCETDGELPTTRAKYDENNDDKIEAGGAYATIIGSHKASLS